MRRPPIPRSLLVLGCALLVAVLPRTTVSSVQPSGEEIPADLIAALAAFDRAQVNADTATLSRLVTDDYLLVNSDGSIDRKQKYLADFLLPGIALDPYVIEQRIDKVLEGTAVVFGLQRLSWRQDGARHQRTLRIVHVWTNRSGRWQATHTQLTRVLE